MLSMSIAHRAVRYTHYFSLTAAISRLIKSIIGYREQHLVECFINKIKHFRRIFSRFDKLDARYLAFLQFAGALIWLW